MRASSKWEKFEPAQTGSINAQKTRSLVLYYYDEYFQSWVGSARLATDLPIDKILSHLQKYGAPNMLIDEILSCVTDTDEKIEIARSVGRHSIVIEVSTTAIEYS